MIGRIVLGYTTLCFIINFLRSRENDLLLRIQFAFAYSVVAVFVTVGIGVAVLLLISCW